MRGRAFKRVSYVPSVKRISYSTMSPTNTSPVISETVGLLDGGQQKRFCCALFRFYGSDGVWAWLVAFANFLINFIIVGLGRMSGILYVEFMGVFHIDRKTASIPFAVQQSARNLFGPVAGILGQKFGIRAVTISGGIIGSLSAIIPYFQMDITSITILWGLFFGISTALTTTINQVSIDQYFEKNRSTAGGFAFSGGCVGAFFFPIVLETLTSHYGIRETFLFMGVIILIVIPTAMVLVEPPWKRKKAAKATYRKNIMKYGSFSRSKGSTSVISSEKQKNPFIKAQNLASLKYGIDFRILQANSDIVCQFLTTELPDENIQQKQSSLHELDKNRLMDELECIYLAIANQEENRENIPISYKINTEKRGELFSRSNVESSIVWGAKRKTRKNCFDHSEHDNASLRVFIESKLKELYQTRATFLIARFPYPNQAKACKVFIELRKIYEKLSEEPKLQAGEPKLQADEPKLQAQEPKLHAAGPKLQAEGPKLQPDESKLQTEETMNESQYSVDERENDDAEKQWDKRYFRLDQDAKTHSNSLWSHIKTAVNLHANPLFLLICLCRGVFMLTFIPVVTIIVDLGMDKGFLKSDGKYIIAVLSLGDFIGRLSFGWITDRGYLSLPRFMVLGMIILGGSTASFPLAHSKISFIVAVLVFAILQGSLFVHHPMLVSQYMKSHEKSIGMGFINFLSGILGFALPAFIGYFRDTLGSYDKMFYVNGVICAVVGLLWLIKPFRNPVSSLISKS